MSFGFLEGEASGCVLAGRLFFGEGATAEGAGGTSTTMSTILPVYESTFFVQFCLFDFVSSIVQCANIRRVHDGGYPEGTVEGDRSRMA